MAQNAPRDEKSLLREIEDLKKRVKTLETAPRSANTSVSHGKFLVQDGDVELLRAGYLGDGGANGDIRGIQMRRPSGELVFSTWTGSETDDGDFWALHDRQGNQIFTDDIISGQGIARPLIGAPVFAPEDLSLWPAVTSDSYTTVWRADWYKQQPRLAVEVWTRTASGTSGDIRMSCNGVTVSESIPGSDNSIRLLILSPDGTFGESLGVEIEMRRDTGDTGFLGGWPMSAYGAGS
jgi:hypothetical protein